MVVKAIDWNDREPGIESNIPDFKSWIQDWDIAQRLGTYW